MRDQLLQDHYSAHIVRVGAVIGTIWLISTTFFGEGETIVNTEPQTRYAKRQTWVAPYPSRSPNFISFHHVRPQASFNHSILRQLHLLQIVTISLNEDIFYFRTK